MSKGTQLVSAEPRLEPQRLRDFYSSGLEGSSSEEPLIQPRWRLKEVFLEEEVLGSKFKIPDFPCWLVSHSTIIHGMPRTCWVLL